MCDFSGRLIAWLDRELAEREATQVEQHLRSCSECQSKLERYRQASTAFSAYYEAVKTSKQRRRLLRWVPMLAGGLAAAVAVLLTLRHTPVEQLPVHSATAAAVSPDAAVEKASGTPRSSSQLARQRPARPIKPANVNWVPTERAIQIAIPAEAMFAPGAIPEGLNFIADVSIAADGSAEGLRLQPELVRLEGRTTQP